MQSTLGLTQASFFLDWVIPGYFFGQQIYKKNHGKDGHHVDSKQVKEKLHECSCGETNFVEASV
jgi:hypothetical protein